MTINFSPLQNLLLNISGGLSLENLKEDEIQLLENEYGKNWKKVLGFGENKMSQVKFLKEIKEWYDKESIPDKTPFWVESLMYNSEECPEIFINKDLTWDEIKQSLTGDYLFRTQEKYNHTPEFLKFYEQWCENCFQEDKPKKKGKKK